MAAQRVGLAIGIITATVLAMALADAIVKYASAAFPLWQIFVLRSLIAVPVLYGLLHLRRGPPIGRPAWRWALLRGLLLTAMYIAIYAAVPLLPLAVIAAALYTGPLFIALLGAWAAGEPVGARLWAALLLGFVGVVTMLRPGLAGFTALVFVPVFAALLYAAAVVLTRTACAKTPPLALALSLNLSLLGVGAVMTLALRLAPPEWPTIYPFLLGPWIDVDRRGWMVIAGLALLIVAIGVGLAAAYQAAPPAVVAAFDYAYLPFAALWGYLFFEDVPDAPTWVGMGLIAIGGAIAAAATGRAPPPGSAATRDRQDA